MKQRVSGTPYHFYECSGDRFLFSGPVFGNLLEWAFEGPRGFTSKVNIAMEGYEIQAKAPGPIQSASQCRLMVQALLADRFKLKFHWEDREAEVPELVVARGGPKMQKALPTDQGTDINIVVDGMPWAPRALEEKAALNIRGMTMEELAARLDTTGPARVVDKTGLEGRYKIELRYSWSAPDRPNADPPLKQPLRSSVCGWRNTRAPSRSRCWITLKRRMRISVCRRSCDRPCREALGERRILRRRSRVPV